MKSLKIKHLLTLGLTLNYLTYYIFNGNSHQYGPAEGLWTFITGSSFILTLIGVIIFIFWVGITFWNRKIDLELFRDIKRKLKR